MTIKTLQNNFTTPEQSKRLLELGVPADSADCFYSWWRGDVCTDEPFGPFIRGTVSAIDYQNDIPCWSVGRLIEIFELCSGEKFERADDGSDIMQDAFETILYIHNTLDFSKLEE